MNEPPSVPTATYRLQFNKDFTFRRARDIVPYLHDLGISHCYASPYFQTASESPHGYDIADHNLLSPAVGSREEYDGFIAELHRFNMGHIVDFVPNHMGIGALNRWWMDVLENGQSSAYAPFFDIDWHPLKKDLDGKVLLPILGDQYGRVLERGEFQVEFEKGAFFVKYFENRFPLAPRACGVILKDTLETPALPAPAVMEMQSILTAIEHLPAREDDSPEKVTERAREKEVAKRRLDSLCNEHPAVRESIDKALQTLRGQPGDARSFDKLDALLTAQPYRLSYWRVAAEEINYRRFFDINALAAIHMERDEVFDAAHKLLLELIGSGAVNGLRIDHVDGLWNPREYFEKLQQRSGGIYLLVEKILTGGERLRKDWAVHGTTGYDFTNQVTQLLVDASAEKMLSETYRRFLGETIRFDDLVYDKKRLTMRLSLASEINVLGSMLDRISEKNRWHRDFTLNALTAAVREVIACFPVYRTYLEPGREATEDDRQVIFRAVAAAKRRNPAIEVSVFDFLRDILLMKFPENIDEEARREHVVFVMKFQQCTGPIIAKGLEDTAFYIYNRLVALNEVGGEPQRFGSSAETFHRQCLDRLAEWPHAMLATSTHDTKRSEDARARAAALSEIPVEWRRAVQKWRSANRRHKRDIEGRPAPDANEEYLLYQTLLCVWPAETSRIQDYMTKAIKEAKINSSWIQPNEAWDEAVRNFVEKILKPGGRFLTLFQPVAERIAALGVINSLSQVILKCTAPGVPDIYQGNETWDFSLVDPDNRRPVDYSTRPSGNKFFVTRTLLNLRREHPDLFAKGDYVPLEVTGRYKECCIAFKREWQGLRLVVLAPRLTARVGSPPLGEAWGDTAVNWNGALRDIFTGREMESIRLAEVFSEFPFAALTTPSMRPGPPTRAC